MTAVVRKRTKPEEGRIAGKKMAGSHFLTSHSNGQKGGRHGWQAKKIPAFLLGFS
jgi:hypothetical protein